MSDFYKTVSDWKRMCLTYSDSGNCQGCPLVTNSVCGELYGASSTDIRRAGATITAWAAVNPEPTYPTYLQWLHTQLPELRGLSDSQAVHALAVTRLDPETADRLGIQPEEDPE